MSELGEQVRKGLPFGSLEALMERFDLSRETVAEALQLPPRTPARRKHGVVS